MFIVKKLITPFILPPGLFVLVFLVGGTVLFCRKYRKIGAAAIVAGTVMWCMSITPVTDFLRVGLTRDITIKDSIPEGDVIVLLGGGVDDRLTDLSGLSGILSEPMTERTVTAVRLYTRLRVPVIVSGGKPFGRQVAESEVARRYLEELGVPGGAIIEEKSSRDTFENARTVRRICNRLGFRQPILVTTGYHLKRALWTFKRVGLNCVPFANGLSSIEGRNYSWDHYLPGSFEGFSQYMHEYIGLLYYRLVY